MKKILILEDDPAIRFGLETALKDEGYTYVSADDGAEGFSLASEGKFDLILLDVILPSISGFDICSNLRKSGVFTPIIIITSKKEEVDRVIGLELGADDYITKPFSIRELLARMRAIFRRATEFNGAQGLVAFENIEINFGAHTLKRNGRDLEITNTELKLLKFFCDHENMVLSREKILNEVWGYESFPTTRTVDNFILSLRKKIEKDFSNPKHIITAHRGGYKFVL